MSENPAHSWVILNGMDCPNCGLANPPNAGKCDCGYNFEKREAASNPGWEINLAWRQKVAAYWAISWPALLASFVALSVPASTLPLEGLASHAVGMSLIAFVAFFGVQALLTRRLVRKKFRTFRLEVIREDGVPSHELSMRESFWIWLWIFGPQLALSVIFSIILQMYGNRISAERAQTLPSLAVWLRFLVVGPYAIELAMRMKYRGFRLQARGYRYI